jgi:hypothetical protein
MHDTFRSVAILLTSVFVAVMATRAVARPLATGSFGFLVLVIPFAVGIGVAVALMRSWPRS